MSTHAPALSRAFSLVEVLVAVLVLALGLLGLGAVFPVVVRQQRIATQATLGVSAGEAAKQVLLNNANFKPGGRGWPALREYALDNGGRTGSWVPVFANPDTGNYVMDPAPGDSNSDPIVLPLSQRLSPLPFSSDSEPRFVWDLAARVTNPLAPTQDQQLLVALFLRPIDPGIRPGRYRDGNGDSVPFSLVTTLVGNVSKANRRYPVSVDGDGRPTFDGRHAGAGGNYALPVGAEAALPAVDRDEPVEELSLERMIRGETDLDVAISALSSPGQKFIDRRGYVHTVTGSRTEDSTRYIQFMPPLADPEADGVLETEVNPIFFVPQAPVVDPLVFLVTP